MRLKTLLLCALIIFAPAYAGAEDALEGDIHTIIPDAVSVEAITSEKISTTLEPTDGTHSGLQADFKIKTNTTNGTYDFVISGIVTTNDGDKNCYFNKNGQMYIILANTRTLPDSSSYNDLISEAPSNNPNLIAYPINTGSDVGVTIRPELYNGELSYIFTSENNQDLLVSQYVSGVPLQNSYAITEDKAGIYRSVLTINVYPINQ